jgi:hypothetical protein
MVNDIDVVVYTFSPALDSKSFSAVPAMAFAFLEHGFNCGLVEFYPFAHGILSYAYGSLSRGSRRARAFLFEYPAKPSDDPAWPDDLYQPAESGRCDYVVVQPWRS